VSHVAPRAIRSPAAHPTSPSPAGRGLERPGPRGGVRPPAAAGPRFTPWTRIHPVDFRAEPFYGAGRLQSCAPLHRTVPTYATYAYSGSPLSGKGARNTWLS